MEFARLHGLAGAGAIVGIDVRAAATVAVAGIFPLTMAAANGGYFPTSWGWGAIALAWVAALAASTATRFRAAELAWLAALLGFAGWIWLSWVWSSIGSDTWFEGLRVLVLPLGIAAVLLVARAPGLPLLIGSLLFAVAGISVYAVATRLFPDRLGTFDPVAVYRLSTPVGYWNALGLLSAMGVLLAVGVAGRSAGVVSRSLAAAVLPILAVTIYFTFSRGSTFALGIALVAAVAVDPRRLQLTASAVVLAPGPAVGVWLASRSQALTHQQAQLVQASHDGHRVASVLAALVLVNAAVGVALGPLSSRFGLTDRTSHVLTVAVAVCAVAALAAGAGSNGGPVRLIQRAHDAFTAPPPQLNGDLNQRFLSFSGNGRAPLWRAAWSDYTAHPLLGSGAGSYEQWWLQHRTIASKVRDAHSLYLETLAELGPLGLMLLIAALAIPLTALARARRHPLVPTLAGAYVAFLVHAAVDWDWEMPAVTLTALFCAAGILIAARRGEERPLPQRVRLSGVIAVLVLMAVGFVGLVGNIELSRAGTAARAGKWATASRDARHAHTWALWSSEPWQQLGEAQLGLGDLPAAQASFREAIAKSPKDWSLWFDLARASSGRAQAQALAQAHRLNPLSPEIAEFEKELASQGSIGVVEK